MTTPLSLLCQLCGISHREAADFLGVSRDTIKAWSSGRNPTPQRALKQLADLSGEIDEQVEQQLEFLKKLPSTGFLDLNTSDPDDDVKARGWPCLGVYRAFAARLYAVCIRNGLKVT